MMSNELNDWNESGEFICYGPLKHKMFVKQVGNPDATSEKTLLLIHGFPESSYSYHGIVDGMLKIFDRIILFDMLGYGLSNKPDTYTYALMEQADTAFEVWKHFGVKGGHILSHDMGVSVATEILARHENDLIPAWFGDGIQSLTFTNGSMVLELAELRFLQKWLLSKYNFLIRNRTTFKIFNQQVRSAHGNDNISSKEVELLWEANCINDGHKKAYLTIKYLHDRKRFEKTRWLPALASTKIPVHLCWGNDDNVARVVMAHHLKEHVCKDAKLTIMDGLGHFCQLGSPDKWVKYVGAFYDDIVGK